MATALVTSALQKAQKEAQAEQDEVIQALFDFYCRRNSSGLIVISPSNAALSLMQLGFDVPASNFARDMSYSAFHSRARYFLRLRDPQTLANKLFRLLDMDLSGFIGVDEVFPVLHDMLGLDIERFDVEDLIIQAGGQRKSAEGLAPSFVEQLEEGGATVDSYGFRANEKFGDWMLDKNGFYSLLRKIGLEHALGLLSGAARVGRIG